MNRIKYQKLHSPALPFPTTAISFIMVNVENDAQTNQNILNNRFWGLMLQDVFSISYLTNTKV